MKVNAMEFKLINADAEIFEETISAEVKPINE